MTTDKHGNKQKRDESESFPPVLYAKLIYSGTPRDKILSLFRTKNGKVVDKVDPMLYFEKYCTVKMALIIESIYISDEYVSIQIKVRECYVKPSQKIEPMLAIRDGDSDEESE